MNSNFTEIIDTGLMPYFGCAFYMVTQKYNTIKLYCSGTWARREIRLQRSSKQYRSKKV